MKMQLKDIPEDFTLVQTDIEIEGILESIGYSQIDEYSLLAVKEKNGEYVKVYGLYSESLDSFVDELYNNGA
jgi:hypothetical protein